MSSHHPPLTYKQVAAGLTKLGFKMEPKTGTAHEQWKKHDGKRFWKVTVDKPLSPYGPMLISSMAKQAGVSKKEFYKVCRE